MIYLNQPQMAELAGRMRGAVEEMPRVPLGILAEVCREAKYPNSQKYLSRRFGEKNLIFDDKFCYWPAEDEDED